jgi:outer membrane protein assembly factor BamB
VGGGYASFVIADGRTFTIEQRRDQEVVTAYDLATGREVWAQGYAAQFSEAMGGDGPRATPTWHAGRLYSLGALGEFLCLDAASGRVVWRTNLLGDLGANGLYFGLSASPLVVDDTVVALSGEPAGAVKGQPRHGVLAFDCGTGVLRWSALKEKMAYASPMLVTLAGERQILVVTSTRACGLRPADGTLLWETPWKVQYDNAIAQPVLVASNRFLLSGGYGTGCALIEVTRAGDGKWAAQSLWKNQNLKNKFNSSVFHEGHVYGLDEGILTCLDAVTGRRVWKDGRYGYGQLLLSGQHLVVLSGEGDLALVKATPAGHQEVSRFAAIPGKTWNHPVLAGGLLLVRNAAEMACFRAAP